MQRQHQGRPAHDHGDQRDTGNRDVNGKDVLHRLLQIAEDASAQANATHDGCKVVVHQHQVGGFPCHIGTACAHGDAHMCGLQGRSVVHAVACHGHHFAVGLQRLNNAQLLVRRDACTHRDVAQALTQGRIAQAVEFFAAQRGAFGQPGLPCDFAGGDREVARDHDDLDARRLAVGHGLRNFGAQGVGQADQTQPFKVKSVRAIWVVIAFKATVRHRQHTQALRGHLRDAGQPTLALAITQVAQVHDGLGCAFGRNNAVLCLLKLPDMRHGFEVGAEGVALHQLALAERPVGVLELALAHGMECGFHRVKGRGGAGQNSVFDQGVKGRRQRCLGRGCWVGRARRIGPVHDVARFCHACLTWHRKRGHGHAVLCQGAGFVGAQHTGCSQGFDGIDVTGEHAFACQSACPHGRKQREYHRIFFRQDGHGQGDACQQSRQPLPGAPTQGQHHHNTEHSHQAGQHFDQPCGLSLQGGVGLLHLGQRLADLANLAVHAGGGDLCPPTATNHKSAAMNARGWKWNLVSQPVCGWHFGQNLVNGHGFTRQQGFVNLQVVGRQQPAIGGHPVAF